VSGSSETSPCSAADDASCVDGPAWLTSDGGWSANRDAHMATPSIGGPRLAFDPNGGVSAGDMPAQSMADLVGAFDHPASQGCRPHGVGAGVGSMTEAAARLECRARFVVTAVEFDRDYPVANGPSVTVSDRLRVRSEPGLDSDRHELLPIGTSVWVVDGPVVAADYEWFQVIVPRIEVAGAPRVGWVAESDHGGERWLAQRHIDCPGPGLMSVAELARLVDAIEPHRGLACFGSSTISVRGSVQLVCGTEGRPAWDLSPAWLSANAFYQVSIRDGSAVVRARPGPDLGIPLACNALADAPVLVEAHFGDAVAASCEASPRAGGAPPDLGAVSVYWCQTTLVIDRLTPMPAVVPTAVPTG
jgi:hypothetical protein